MKIMDSAFFRKIADEYGVDASQVKRESEAAIRIAADNPTPLWLEMFGEGHIPTIDEFLEKVREKIQVTA
ncbi:MAG: hypothetical protein IJN70_07905 [Clostridia bacterium]|nr:hypothetical protein [Clostridia bacterium]